MNKYALVAALALASLTTLADDAAPQAPAGAPAAGEQAGATRRPPLPIVAALDANGDGVIDAQEIANAAAALKSLDKNGDGKLTPDEFMPPHRGAGPGAGGAGEGMRQHRAKKEAK